MLALAIVICGVTAIIPASAQESVTVERLNQLITTPNAAQEPAIIVRGVVTHMVPLRKVVSIQDATGGIVVRLPAEVEPLQLGQEIEVRAIARQIGKTIDTVITADAIKILGSPGIPQRVKCTLGDVIAGTFNRRAVEVEGTVIAAFEKNGISQLLLTDGTTTAIGLIYAVPPDWNPSKLIDSRIRFQGIAGGAGFTALRCSTAAEISILGPSSPADSGLITRARELIDGGTEQARKERPIRVRGTCVYANARKTNFFLHDGSGGVIVNVVDPVSFPEYGEEVEVAGVTMTNLDTVGISAVTITRHGKGPIPPAAPVPVSANGLAYFSQWVEVEGVVFQARGNASGGVQLLIAGDNSWCTVEINSGFAVPENRWAGARIRARGVNARNPRLFIFCAEGALVELIAAGAQDPFGARATSIEALVAEKKPSAERVKIEGTVLEVQDGWIYLRKDGGALRADLLTRFIASANWPNPLTPEPPPFKPRVGQVLELVGSPMVAGQHVDFRFAQARLLRDGEVPSPAQAEISAVASGAMANNLVTARARLRGHSKADLQISESINRTRETLRVERDGAELEIVYENSGAGGSLAGFKVDDEIEATGIVRPESGSPPYRLCIRSLNDVHSLGEAPEVGRARQIRLFGIIGAIVLVAGVWIALLRSRLKRERQVAKERARADRAVRELNMSLESRVGQRTAELQTAQEELKRALAAEREVGELKSRFVALVSHEFRTPLGITMSAVELLRGYMDRLPEAERKELLDDIHQATLRMAAMMEQVLLLGKVEEGKVNFNAEPIDLQQFGEKIADEMRSATNAKCPLEFSVENDLRGAAGDENLIRHLLSNLLSNAVKYSPAGKPVEFRIRREGVNAVVTVRDHGIGIPPADQQRLFEAFHRAGNVGTTPGTGLGLLIVKRCAELHGGSVRFESRENEGTTFTVRLPLFETAK